MALRRRAASRYPARCAKVKYIVAASLLVGACSTPHEQSNSAGRFLTELDSLFWSAENPDSLATATDSLRGWIEVLRRAAKSPRELSRENKAHVCTTIDEAYRHSQMIVHGWGFNLRSGDVALYSDGLYVGNPDSIRAHAIVALGCKE